MWSKIEQCLQEAVEQEIFPGCALSIRYRGEEVFLGGFGLAEIYPNLREADTQTIWDLASLTKVLCTAPLYLLWVNDGLMNLDDELSDLLPSVPKGVTIRNCLSHSSGYPNWRPLYSSVLDQKSSWTKGTSRKQVIKMAIETPLFAKPNFQYKYSDLGFIALCAYAEARFGKQIHILWQEYLPKDARKDLYWGHPDAAATEDCPLRRRMIIGETHDLNAAAMAGRSSHSGLFGTVSALSAAASWPLLGYQGRSDALSQTTVRHFWAARGAGSHCLGWDTPSTSGSSASASWPRNGVGHLGFTGTSVWIAPDLDLVAGFASNRVHPKVEGGSQPNAPLGPKTKAYRAFRPQLHKIIIEAFSQ